MRHVFLVYAPTELTGARHGHGHGYRVPGEVDGSDRNKMEIKINCYYRNHLMIVYEPLCGFHYPRIGCLLRLLARCTL